MKITIEVGTEEQKELIRQELLFIAELCETIENPPKITGIWVPSDFDNTVNILQGTTDYVSERGHLAVAKNVIQEQGTALVFSPLLFTDSHDNQTRLQIYLHEFWHTLNKQIFPEIPKDSLAKYEYFQTIYILYDEYSANRKSFELTEKGFPNASDRYKRLTRNSVTGFLRDIIKAEKHYQYILKEIFKFRLHANVSLFLKNTRDIFDLIAKSLVYFYSYVHHYQKHERLIKFLNGSKFVDENAFSLVDFLKTKYEEGDTDLVDGLIYLKNFMKKFGIEFEDKPEGLYCHVIDIQSN